MDISQDNTLKEFTEACKSNLLLNLKFLKSSQPVLWNRNRRNRNFMASGTGTVTCKKVRTGTVTNYGSGTELDIKLCIWLSSFKIFIIQNEETELFKKKDRNRNHDF